MSLQTQKMDARWLFVRNVICKAKLWWLICFQGVDFGVFVSRAKQPHYLTTFFSTKFLSLGETYLLSWLNLFLLAKPISLLG